MTTSTQRSVTPTRRASEGPSLAHRLGLLPSLHEESRYMATYMAKKGAVPQRWFLIDATDQVVGRLAVQIANLLRGKHRPEYTPHVDTGEFVVVINAEKVRFTGKKLDSQQYVWYTRYPGGLKRFTARQWLETHPDRILREAVRRMVPRNR